MIRKHWKNFLKFSFEMNLLSKNWYINRKYWRGNLEKNDKILEGKIPVWEIKNVTLKKEKVMRNNEDGKKGLII